MMSNKFVLNMKKSRESYSRTRTYKITPQAHTSHFDEYRGVAVRTSGAIYPGVPTMLRSDVIVETEDLFLRLDLD